MERGAITRKGRAKGKGKAKVRAMGMTRAGAKALLQRHGAHIAMDGVCIRQRIVGIRQRIVGRFPTIWANVYSAPHLEIRMWPIPPRAGANRSKVKRSKMN